MSATKIIINKLIVSVLFCVLCNHAWAGTAADIIRNGEEQIRLLRDRDAEIAERIKQPKEVIIPFEKEQEGELIDSGTSCFVVNELVLQGATQLSTAEVNQLKTVVEGQCVGMSQLSLLLKRITNIYIEKGYVTTRAYIPEQNLSSGVLEILVVEGKLEAFSADDSAKVNLITAFPFMEGNILDLKDIEQGLSQINRLQSNHASMTLEPGSKPGLTRIIIHNKPSFPLSANVGWDNTDGRTAQKVNAGLGIDNLLGLNDYVSLRWRKDTDFNYGDDYSDNFSFNGVIPFGYLTLSSSASYLRYQSKFSVGNSQIVSRGTSLNWNVNTDYLLYRNRKMQLSLSAGLSHRDTENYLNDIFLEISSRKLSIVQVGLNGSYSVDKLFMSSSFTFNQGVKLLDALEDKSKLPESAPKAQFRSYQGRLSVNAPIQLGSLRSQLSSTLSGQYSEDELFGSEQFTVAGYYGVRGYLGSSAASRGAHIRNELSITLPYSGIEMIDSNLQKYLSGAIIRPYIAYDYGRTNERFGNDDRIFSSWTVGMDTHWHGLGVKLSYSTPLHKSVNQQENNPIGYLTLSYAI